MYFHKIHINFKLGSHSSSDIKDDIDGQLVYISRSNKGQWNVRYAEYGKGIPSSFQKYFILSYQQMFKDFPQLYHIVYYKYFCVIT